MHLLNPALHARCSCACLQGSRGLAAAAQKEVQLPPQHGIPGRYAAALYMAAVKGENLAKVEEELSNVATLMSESKDFNAFVADPSVPRATKIDGLNSVLTKMGATDITKNFIGARSAVRVGGVQCGRPCGCGCGWGCGWGASPCILSPRGLSGECGCRTTGGGLFGKQQQQQPIRPPSCAMPPLTPLPWLPSPLPCPPPRPPAGLLSDNNRLSELGRILGKFEEIVADQRGEVKAVVTTAEVRVSACPQTRACLHACMLCVTASVGLLARWPAGGHAAAAVRRVGSSWPAGCQADMHLAHLASPLCPLSLPACLPAWPAGAEP